MSASCQTLVLTQIQKFHRCCRISQGLWNSASGLPSLCIFFANSQVTPTSHLFGFSIVHWLLEFSIAHLSSPLSISLKLWPFLSSLPAYRSPMTLATVPLTSPVVKQLNFPSLTWTHLALFPNPLLKSLFHFDTFSPYQLFLRSKLLLFLQAIYTLHLV